MKILLLKPFFYPDDSGIACAIRGEAFAKYLNKKGIKINVLVPEKKNVSKKSINYEGCTVERIVTYDTIRESYPLFLSTFYLPISVLKLIRKTKNIRPNLIIVSTPGPLLPLESLLVAKALRIPLIFDIEDSWHMLRNNHKGVLRNYLKMSAERLCANYSDLIFTVTPTLKEIVRSGYNIPEDKIKVVYNGVDLEIIPKTESSETIDLIHLGSPRTYYDTIKLIDAFYILNNFLPGTNLHFIGCTTENYVEKVKQYVDKKGLSKSIKFIGFVKHENVPYELAKAKIGVISTIDLPEYTCGIGVKIFEYMAAGLPTAYLGPSNSEQERIIRNNNIGICSTEPDGFAKAVINLLKDKSLRFTMGNNAKRTVEEYNRERIINKAYDNYILPILKNSGE